MNEPNEFNDSDSILRPDSGQQIQDLESLLNRQVLRVDGYSDQQILVSETPNDNREIVRSVTEATPDELAELTRQQSRQRQVETTQMIDLFSSPWAKITRLAEKYEMHDFVPATSMVRDNERFLVTVTQAYNLLLSNSEEEFRKGLQVLLQLPELNRKQFLSWLAKTNEIDVLEILREFCDENEFDYFDLLDEKNRHEKEVLNFKNLLKQSVQAVHYFEGFIVIKNLILDEIVPKIIYSDDEKVLTRLANFCSNKGLNFSLLQAGRNPKSKKPLYSKTRIYDKANVSRQLFDRPVKVTDLGKRGGKIEKTTPSPADMFCLEIIDQFVPTRLSPETWFAFQSRFAQLIEMMLHGSEQFMWKAPEVCEVLASHLEKVPFQEPYPPLKETWDLLLKLDPPSHVAENLLIIMKRHGGLQHALALDLFQKVDKRSQFYQEHERQLQELMLLCTGPSEEVLSRYPQIRTLAQNIITIFPEGWPEQNVGFDIEFKPVDMLRPPEFVQTGADANGMGIPELRHRDFVNNPQILSYTPEWHKRMLVLENWQKATRSRLVSFHLHIEQQSEKNQRQQAQHTLEFFFGNDSDDFRNNISKGKKDTFEIRLALASYGEEFMSPETKGFKSGVEIHQLIDFALLIKETHIQLDQSLFNVAPQDPLEKRFFKVASMVGDPRTRASAAILLESPLALRIAPNRPSYIQQLQKVYSLSPGNNEWAATWGGFQWAFDSCPYSLNDIALAEKMMGSFESETAAIRAIFNLTKYKASPEEFSSTVLPLMKNLFDSKIVKDKQAFISQLLRPLASATPHYWLALFEKLMFDTSLKSLQGVLLSTVIQQTTESTLSDTDAIRLLSSTLHAFENLEAKTIQDTNKAYLGIMNFAVERKTFIPEKMESAIVEFLQEEVLEKIPAHLFLLTYDYFSKVKNDQKSFHTIFSKTVDRLIEKPAEIQRVFLTDLFLSMERMNLTSIEIADWLCDQKNLLDLPGENNYFQVTVNYIIRTLKEFPLHEDRDNLIQKTNTVIKNQDTKESKSSSYAVKLVQESELLKISAEDTKKRIQEIMDDASDYQREEFFSALLKKVAAESSPQTLTLILDTCKSYFCKEDWNEEWEEFFLTLLSQTKIHPTTISFLMFHTTHFNSKVGYRTITEGYFSSKQFLNLDEASGREMAALAYRLLKDPRLENERYGVFANLITNTFFENQRYSKFTASELLSLVDDTRMKDEYKKQFLEIMIYAMEGHYYKFPAEDVLEFWTAYLKKYKDLMNSGAISNISTSLRNQNVPAEMATGLTTLSIEKESDYFYLLPYYSSAKQIPPEHFAKILELYPTILERTPSNRKSEMFENTLLFFANFYPQEKKLVSFFKKSAIDLEKQYGRSLTADILKNFFTALHKTTGSLKRSTAIFRSLGYTIDDLPGRDIAKALE